MKPSLPTPPSHDIRQEPGDAPRTILVLAREHLGDLVCTTPALRSLRRLYPKAHIAVKLGVRACCILENNPNVDELIPRPKSQGLSGKWKFIRMMRRRRFDLAVILDDSTDMPLHVWLGGIPRRVGLVRKKRFAHLLTDRIPYDENAHEMIDNFRNVVALLGADISDNMPELFPTVAEVEAVDRLFQEAGLEGHERLIAFNPSTSVSSRCWPPERFAELGNLLSEQQANRILVLGGPADMALAQSIVARMRVPPIVLTGTTVMQQAEIERRCAVLVAGDTGPTHIACAVGTPVVALHGPTDPRDFGPVYAPGNIMIRKVSGCPGCTWTHCIRQNECMRRITAQEVADAVAQIVPPLSPAE